MEFGIPKEVRDLEMRVGINPAGVQALVYFGHTVYVESNAGAGAGFSDEHYRRAGAQIVFSAAEAYGRADVVVKVTRPTAAEHRLFRQGQMICSFFHLSVSSPDLVEALTEREITAIAYETIESRDGQLPVVIPMSEIAGRLAPIIAGQLLMKKQGGLGVLLSGIPGVPPAATVVVGAGVLGFNAARSLLGIGAQVTVLDRDIRTLQLLDDAMPGQVTTMVSNEYNLSRAVQFADVLVGCVLVPGERAPVLITREMIRQMRPGSVIIDFSIDQGGCLETSRPTTLRDQTYVEEGVIHFCVPNYTAAVPRTTTHALTNAIVPYLMDIGEYGLLGTLKRDPALAHGINVYQGRLSHEGVAKAMGRELETDLFEHIRSGDAL
jgi:alanine dehydrogenase